MPVGRNVLRVRALVVGEEEELVLDDGTAECEAIHLFLTRVGLRVLDTVYAVTVHVLVGVVEVGRTFEGVCTRLGHSVDTTANEVGLANIEWSNHHLYLVNGIHRDGVATAG